MQNTKMHACSLYGIRDLRYMEVDIPEVGEEQVLVKIRAAGICGSDVERVFTKGTYHYPTIIGHEFAGEVVSTTDPEDPWLGKRVAVFPLIPCQKCDQCRKGNYASCSGYDYYGSRRDGGFAEYMAINKWNLLELPENVSFEDAAMIEPAAVAANALKRFSNPVGRNLVIFGVGTIGLILAQMAENAGCNKVILVARSARKVEAAYQMGFKYVINSSVESVKDRIMELTDGVGAELVVEGCGQEETLNESLNCAATCGEIVCMGNPALDMGITRDKYWMILRKQLSLYGIWNSHYGFAGDDWHTVLNMLAKGQLDLSKLITGRYRLEQCNEAFEDIYDNRDNKLHLKTMFINE